MRPSGVWPCAQGRRHRRIIAGSDQKVARLPWIGTASSSHMALHCTGWSQRGSGRVCEPAGLPPQDGIAGRSFGPVLRGEMDGHRREAVTAPRRLRAVRTDHHRLIENYGDVDELYDPREDPAELHNLAGGMPEKVRELRQRMGARFPGGGCCR